jgi:DNA-binding NarL/FixJ family response regulator
LQKAIDTILNKETYYCQHLISQIQENNTEKKNSLRNKVTTSVKISKREKEIIRLIRRGMPSKDIGETLGISVRTVGKHRENIMRKCNVGNVTELIYFIEKNEIII